MFRDFFNLSNRFFALPAIALFLASSIAAAQERSSLVATFSIIAVNCQQRDSEPRKLITDKPIREEISGGGSRSYQIAVSAGQYLRLAVDKEDFALTLTLFDTAGRKLAEYESHRYGTAYLSMVADVAGDYRLELRSLEKDAAACEVRIEEARAATSIDGDRIAAERVFAQADKLAAECKTDSLKEAITKYEEARLRWQLVGNRQQQADALKNAGDVCYRLSEYKKARGYYEQALSLSQAEKDRRGEIEAINSIAAVAVLLGEIENAVTGARQAQQLSQETGDRRGQARALNILGEAFYFSDGMQKAALDAFNQSLALWRAASDRRGQARALINLGYCYYDLRDMQKALEHYKQSLALCQATGDCRGQASALTAIGGVYWYLGENQTSLGYHNEAANLFRAVGDRNGEGTTLVGIGSVYDYLGEPSRALEYYNRAADLFHSLGSNEYESYAIILIAKLYYLLGDNTKALEYYNRVISLNQTVSYGLTKAQAHNGMGLAYTSLGDYERALTHYNKSLELYRAAEDRVGQSYALNNIGRIFGLKGDYEKALDHFTKALALSRESLDPAGETSALFNIARVERDLGNLTQARAKIEESFKIIESMRSKVASEELRASYIASVHRHYELYIDLLMLMHEQRATEGLDALALQVSERARARSLLDLLAEARANIRQGVDESLLQNEAALRQELDAKERARMQLLNREHTEQQVAQLEKQMSDLLARYQETQAQIRAKSPRYAALTQPQPLTLAEIQQQALDSETLLLEYSLGEDRSYLWAVTQTSIKSFTLPGRKQIESQAQRIYELITSARRRDDEPPRQYLERAAKVDAQYWKQASRFSQTLLGPVASLLGNKRLLIVAEGALQYVPFSALPLPISAARSPAAPAQARSDLLFSESLAAESFRPLIVDHEIITPPSASTLALLRRETAGRKFAPRTIAVLADPVFEKDDERLKSAAAAKKVKTAALTRDGLKLQRLWTSGQEAKAILATVPPEEKMLATGFNANLEAVKSPELRKYRIIHFATHALLDNKRPELSGIVLSLFDERGETQNGFLRLHDIYNLELPAELIVLSACNTGLGKDIRGEGLVGLTRGFMYAGAARVVASLWNVNDLATKKLMKRFYEGMLREGLRPTEALRRAQVEMWKQSPGKSPYYWAAFIFQGNWN